MIQNLTDGIPAAETPQREPCWRCGSQESRVAERTENLNLIRCRECDAYLGNEEHAEGEAMRLFRAGTAAHLQASAERIKTRRATDVLPEGAA